MVGSRSTAWASLCPWETCPLLPKTGQSHPHSSPSVGGTALPHGTRQQCLHPTGRGQARRRGIADYGSVIPGKPPSHGLAGGGYSLIPTHEQADQVPFESRTILGPQGAGRSLTPEVKELMWQSAKSHYRARFRGPGAQMLEISSRSSRTHTCTY